MSEPPSQGRYSSAPAWEPAVNRIYWIVLSLTLLFLLFVFASVIPFLFFALVLAYLTVPIVRFFQNRLFGGKRRGAAIALTFVLTVVLLLAAVVAFVPPIIEQTRAVLASLPGTLESLISIELAPAGSDAEPFVLRDWLVQQEAGAVFVEFLDNLSRESETGGISLLSFIGGSLSTLRFDTFGFVTGAVQTMLNAIFFVMILIYLWADWENIVESLLQLTPDPFDEDVRRLVWELGQIWNSYLRGELIIAAVMGTLAWALAFAAGMPNPLFIGFFVGLLEFIPNIGPGLAAVVLGSTAFVNPSLNFPELSGTPMAIIVLIVWIAMLQFQGGFLVPRVLGNSLRLHPIIVILAVMWGASIGGVIGIIIAGPIVATMRLVLQYIYGRLTGRPAFPPHTEDDPASGFFRQMRQRFSRSSSAEKQER